MTAEPIRCIVGLGLISVSCTSEFEQLVNGWPVEVDAGACEKGLQVVCDFPMLGTAGRGVLLIDADHKWCTRVQRQPSAHLPTGSPNCVFLIVVSWLAVTRPEELQAVS